jgi:hypothetical protein
MNIDILGKKGKIEKIYVSDLEFLMIKIDNLNGTYTTYNCGKYQDSKNVFIDLILKNKNESDISN